MSVQILRRRVDHDIGTVLHRAEVDRARERRVDDEREAAFLGEVADRPQVDDPARRVHGRFHEDGARLLSHALSPCPRFHGVHERHVDPHRRELLGEQRARPAVDPTAGEQVIAGSEQGEQGAGGGAHAAGEHDARLRAVQHRQSALDHLGVRGVAVTWVAEAVGRADFLDEVHRLHERLNDGCVGFAVRRAAGDGDGGQPQAARRSRHVVRWR